MSYFVRLVSYYLLGSLSPWESLEAWFTTSNERLHAGVPAEQE
ncbi:hypothetical protein ACFW1P_18835 [Paenibacillus sp. NPDC058910]